MVKMPSDVTTAAMPLAASAVQKVFSMPGSLSSACQYLQ